MMISFALLLHLWFPYSVAALDVTPQIEKESLSVQLTEINYPDKFYKDLTSGLTNKLYLRALLKKGNRVIAWHSTQISIRYDLWDEKFWVQRVPGPSREGVLRSDLFEELKSIDLKRIFILKDLKGQHYVEVDLLLNPVHKERMEQIQKWVANNSVGPTLDAGSGRSLKTKGRSKDSLFNTIFEQFTRGESLAGVWKTSARSKLISMNEVPGGK